MIDIQTVACFNTRSPILHLFLPIQCQIHNNNKNKYFINLSSRELTASIGGSRYKFFHSFTGIDLLSNKQT